MDSLSGLFEMCILNTFPGDLIEQSNIHSSEQKHSTKSIAFILRHTTI